MRHLYASDVSLTERDRYYCRVTAYSDGSERDTWLWDVPNRITTLDRMPETANCPICVSVYRTHGVKRRII
jgi:hypothetical protein